MKNRLLVVAMAAMCAIGMISCGNPAEPETFEITDDNVDNLIVKFADYEGLEVEVTKQELTDSLVEYYADYYYDRLCHEHEGMLDKDGEPIPMTDEAIKKLDSKVFTTANQFMVFVRNTVADFIEYSYDEEIANEALKQINNDTEFAKFPKELIESEKGRVVKEYTKAAEAYDISLKEYLKLLDTSVDTLAYEYATKDVVLAKLAKELKIDASSEESENQIKEYLKSVTVVNDKEN